MTQSDLGLKGKKLLLLDGSKKAIEIIEHAQRLGVHTIVTDYSNPAVSPAKLAADEYFDVSISDVEAVVGLIDREGIDGVLPGFSDRWLPTYAEICERASLPSYASTEQLKLFTDKKRYKALLEKHGIPTIQGFTREEAESGSIPAEAYPLIVKPADGSGSRGISRCYTLDELHAGISAALEYSWTGDLVIERYLPGEEATVFWVFQDGEHHVAMVANRHMRSFAGGSSRLPVGYTSPSYLTRRYISDIAPRVRSMLQNANVLNGTMFMQGLIDDGVFRTYDIGYRPTPTQEYRVLEELCGYNSMSMLVKFAVTGSMSEPDLVGKANPAFEGYGFNVSTLMMPGTVGSYTGLDEVRSLPGVLSVSTSLQEGETLPEVALGQLRQIAVRTIGVAGTVAELESVMREVAGAVDILGNDGASLAVPSPAVDVRDALLVLKSSEGGQSQ